MQDLKLTFRFLAKKPGWPAAAVLTLAISISGSTLAVSLIDQVVWRPLGFTSGDELVTLYARSAGEYSPLPYQDYLDFRDVLDEGGHAGLADPSLAVAGDPVRLPSCVRPPPTMRVCRPVWRRCWPAWRWGSRSSVCTD